MERGESLQGSKEGIGQGLKWHPERRTEARDVIPIQANGKETETLIPVGSTKQVGEDQIVLICQAEDREANEKSEHVLKLVSCFLLPGLKGRAPLGQFPTREGMRR